MTDQEAIEELKDMAFHPSMKKSLSIKCIATCISVLTEQIKSINNEQELPLVQDREDLKSDEDIRKGIEISRQKYEQEKLNASNSTYKLFAGVDELAERLRELH